MAIHEHKTSRRAVLGAAMAIPAAAAVIASAAIAENNAALDRRGWDAALADYQTKRAFADAIPLGTPNEDDAVDAYCEAMDHLILEVPAPDAEAFEIKAQLAIERCEGFTFDERFAEVIINDALRLIRGR